MSPGLLDQAWRCDFGATGPLPQTMRSTAHSPLGGRTGACIHEPRRRALQHRSAIVSYRRIVSWRGGAFSFFALLSIAYATCRRSPSGSIHSAQCNLTTMAFARAVKEWTEPLPVTGSGSMQERRTPEAGPAYILAVFYRIANQSTAVANQGRQWLIDSILVVQQTSGYALSRRRLVGDQRWRMPAALRPSRTRSTNAVETRAIASCCFRHAFLSSSLAGSLR